MDAISNRHYHSPGRQQVETDPVNISDLANKYVSDKGNKGELRHRYSYLYDLIFYPLRDKPINLLEMGLCIGGPELGLPADRHVESPSVKIWLEYFSRARIFGFDISDFSHQQGPRFRFTRGDSGNIEDLRRIKDMAPDFDVIIDDASHASYHQQLAFKELWDKIPSGGIYIIEDLNWQPHFENDLPAVPKTGHFFQDWFERDTYSDNVLFSRDDMDRISAQVWSYSIFPTFTPNYGDGPKLIALIRA